MVVLTGLLRPSENEKTGPVVQAWILPVGVNPSKALGTERERDVCGDCPLRGRGSARMCYSAFGVWLVSRHLARYERLDLARAAQALAGKVLRLSAYGDPAAIPFPVWAKLLSQAAGATGYTHQWRTCDHRFRDILMASVETSEDARAAAAAGWRYFRIRAPGGPLLNNEVVCPSETRGVRCIDCALCSGAARKGPHVVITVHGRGRAAWMRRFRR